MMLSHTSALEVLRRSDAPRLIERGRLARRPAVPSDMPSVAVSERALRRVAPLRDLERPLDVAVSREAGRHRSELVRGHLLAFDLPADAAFSLAPDVLCAGPELVALQMAEYASDLELLLLVDELCGHYAIQPAASSGLVKRLDPLTSGEKILGLLDRLGAVRGSVKLRRAVERSRARSGSPRESKTAHLLGFGTRAGGFGIEIVSLNEPLLVERAETILEEVSERVRKPDLLILAPEQAPASMPFRGVALDYQGGYHRDPLQESSDINRRNELLACGVKDYEIAAEHFSSLPYLEWLVGRMQNDLGMASRRLSGAERSALDARRARLHASIEEVDGLHWTGRKAPLVMSGSAWSPSDPARELA